MSVHIDLQSLSFAAMLQASKQLYTLGHDGTWNEEEVKPLIKALAVSDPLTAYDVYNPQDVMPGFKILAHCFEKENIKDKKNINIVKYARIAMNLERTITRNSDTTRRLFAKLDRAIEYADENLLDELNIEYLQKLADIYREEITQRNVYAFLVFGARQYLQLHDIQMKIRVMLLCLLRAVVLWRQLGGRRRSFFFRSLQLSNYAKNFVENH